VLVPLSSFSGQVFSFFSSSFGFRLKKTCPHWRDGYVLYAVGLGSFFLFYSLFFFFSSYCFSGFLFPSRPCRPHPGSPWARLAAWPCSCLGDDSLFPLFFFFLACFFCPSLFGNFSDSVRGFVSLFFHVRPVFDFRRVLRSFGAKDLSFFSFLQRGFLTIVFPPPPSGANFLFPLLFFFVRGCNVFCSDRLQPSWA